MTEHNQQTRGLATKFTFSFNTFGSPMGGARYFET